MLVVDEIVVGKVPKVGRNLGVVCLRMPDGDVDHIDPSKRLEVKGWTGIVRVLESIGRIIIRESRGDRGASVEAGGVRRGG